MGCEEGGGWMEEGKNERGGCLLCYANDWGYDNWHMMLLVYLNYVLYVLLCCKCECGVDGKDVFVLNWGGLVHFICEEFEVNCLYWSNLQELGRMDRLGHWHIKQ